MRKIHSTSPREDVRVHTWACTKAWPAVAPRVSPVTTALYTRLGLVLLQPFPPQQRSQMTMCMVKRATFGGFGVRGLSCRSRGLSFSGSP